METTRLQGNRRLSQHSLTRPLCVCVCCTDLVVVEEERALEESCDVLEPRHELVAHDAVVVDELGDVAQHLVTRSDLLDLVYRLLPRHLPSKRQRVQGLATNNPRQLLRACSKNDRKRDVQFVEMCKITIFARVRC